MPDEFRSPLRPPLDYRPKAEPTPAPPWVALVAAWAGLIVLIASVVFIFLPGSRDPRAELELAANYYVADWFIPVPIYGSAVAMFLGIIVIWQMRKLPRPLPRELILQRMQAWVGVALAFLGAAIVYLDVALRGPK
jgi:hypothetical protein